MASPTIMLPSTPRFPPILHTRTASRSPTRTRLMDDLLADLSPATILEAFTSPSGALRASIEAASPTQRAFGIRAAVASKNIQEWLIELSAWPWPTGGSEGFELPINRSRRGLNNDFDDQEIDISEGNSRKGRHTKEDEFWGSLLASDVRQYESRIEEISDGMEDLNVEEIKSQILNTHVLPRSRASSLSDVYVETLSSQPYTKMDDFTAIVTATMIQALPNLSRLIALMGAWSVRLTVLREVPRLIASMNDVEVAIRSGWNAIHALEFKLHPHEGFSNKSTLSRQDYEIMRDVLQEKVLKLGQKIDHMLDTLEGRDDNLPEVWLDRMERIEQEYGEWVVCGERKVREAEWTKEGTLLQQEEMPRLPSQLDGPLQPQHGDCNIISSPQNEFIASGELSGFPNLPNKHIEADSKGFSPSLDSINLENSLLGRLPDVSNPLLSNTQRNNKTPREPQEVRQMKVNTLQPAETLRMSKSTPNNANIQDSLLSTQTFPFQHPNYAPLSQVETFKKTLSDLDGTFEDPVLRDEPPHPTADSEGDSWAANAKQTVLNPAENDHIITPAVTNLIPRENDLHGGIEKYRRLGELSSSTAIHQGFARLTSNGDAGHNLLQPSHSATKDTKMAHSLDSPKPKEINSEILPSKDITNLIHPPQKPDDEAIIDLLESHTAEIRATPQERVREVQNQNFEPIEVNQRLLAETAVPDRPPSIARSILEHKPTYIDLPPSALLSSTDKSATEFLSPEVNSPDSTRGHTRGPSSASIISGYATSEPSPVLHEAEPTEYFRPISPPIIAKLPDLSNITTPTRLSFSSTPVSPKAPELGPTWESETLSSRRSSQGSPNMKRKSSSEFSRTEYLNGSDSAFTSIETSPRRRPRSNDSGISVIRGALSQSRISQDGSVTSEVSTINERLNSVTSTPVRIESPITETVPRSWHSQFVSNYDGDSPSPNLVQLPNDVSVHSPASSPPPETPPHERRPLQLRKTPSFDPDFFSSDSPATPADLPNLSNMELSPTPALSSPSKHSDDQLQQQISEILESIPARIILSSEPEAVGTFDIRPPKKRISLNPFSRPASRAATPSFTLAPAYARNPRPRPQNGNPEIKLYHLSRSTGEAPIKLFVRLVGEHGERVMVRVGGGWADLGEYLKEYASHHGRRSERSSNVEIQDLPPRVVSTGSTTSTATLRKGSWNTSEASSPISRPGSRPSSALGRPLSSLAMRKTRKSVGEEAREKAYRSPSTPLPPSFRPSPTTTRQSETPPSANSARSVSQMSWREEESSLGLAGPRSRKGEISAENAAWVESMKEKVRIASAEKEKKDKAAFGDIGQVGATKRLFKKN